MRQLSISPSVITVFLLSLAYWLYLATFTRMEIVFDAVGYESLGRMIYTQGWIPYFTTGPNREPLYPLLIAISMAFEHITAVSFVKIMAFFGVIIMFVTQAMTYKILRLLNITKGICILVLAYLALSPALNNAAFSLFSEIAEFPFILGIVLTSFYAWEEIKHNKRHRAIFYSMLLGTLLMLATLVKGVFEVVAPVYLIIFFVTVFLTERKIASFPSQRHLKKPPKNEDIGPFDTLQKMTTLFLCFVTAAIFFYVPITGYKWLNWHYNGNFAITDRGAWFLYGNTARRMEPLTLKKFSEALAYVPGEGFCNGIFGQKECDFWTFQKADELGSKKFDELNNQHLPTAKINATLLALSAQKALQNPFQYALLDAVEGFKMFFWETTQVGFVYYPFWLQKIYNIKIFNNGLRLFMSLISMLAVISLWFQASSGKQPPIVFLMGLLVFLYILFFSFFFIIDRYLLPIAPLYLISIGIWLNRYAKNH